MNKWFIAYKERGDDLFDIRDLKIIDSPKGHYYADPFLAEDNGVHWLFFEDYDYVKGRIAVAKLDEEGMHDAEVIIDEPTHLSFPSVFKDGDDWYMTPERVIAGELTIYKATNFPYEWEPVAMVARGRYDDPVLRKTKDGYQIWCSEGGDKLRVFFSETILGEWNLRISEDVLFSRSAGHFIGDIRPVQDIMPTYGRAIRFIEHGTTIAEIEPTWFPGLTGTHTFNVDSKFVVMDGRVQLQT